MSEKIEELMEQVAHLEVDNLIYDGTGRYAGQRFLDKEVIPECVEKLKSILKKLEALGAAEKNKQHVVDAIGEWYTAYNMGIAGVELV